MEVGLGLAAEQGAAAGRGLAVVMAVGVTWA